MPGSLRFWQRMCRGAEEGFALRLRRIRSPQDQAEWDQMREEFGKKAVGLFGGLALWCSYFGAAAQLRAARTGDGERPREDEPTWRCCRRVLGPA
jgi:hypothetical protein